MTRFSSDQLAKQYLQDFLEPLGIVQRNFEVPGEPKYVDVFFSPNPNPVLIQQDLGLLNRITVTPCLLEPFRNAPSPREIKTCQLKLLWVQEDQWRKAEREKQQLQDTELAHLWILATRIDQQLQDTELAHLWILATRIDQPTLDRLAVYTQPDWPTGVFFYPGDLQTTLVAINKLPVTPETLWLRLLGKGKTLERAVTEVLALPADDTRRSQVLQLLTNWRVSLQLENPLVAEEQELMATLSQAYLEWEQRTEQRGREQGRQEEAAALILRQLTRSLRLDSLPEPLCSQMEQLSLPQLEALSEALLDFQCLADLEGWLRKNCTN